MVMCYGLRRCDGVTVWKGTNLEDDFPRCLNYLVKNDLEVRILGSGFEGGPQVSDTHLRFGKHSQHSTVLLDVSLFGQVRMFRTLGECLQRKVL